MAKIKKPDFIEYHTDPTGKVHILNVFCKCCGTRIQTGYMMKNQANVKVPFLAPSEDYVDMYMAYEDANGTLRRKSTPMCEKCAKEDFSKAELDDLYAADLSVMEARHAQSKVEDPNVARDLEDRKASKPVRKIGYCIPGYVISGEGR